MTTKARLAQLILALHAVEHRVDDHNVRFETAAVALAHAVLGDPIKAKIALKALDDEEIHAG